MLPAFFFQPLRFFAASTRHDSTSALVFVGHAQRTALIESKTTSRKGNLIAEANCFFDIAGNFL